jgi:hypothetical protein
MNSGMLDDIHSNFCSPWLPWQSIRNKVVWVLKCMKLTVFVTIIQIKQDKGLLYEHVLLNNLHVKIRDSNNVKEI